MGHCSQNSNSFPIFQMAELKDGSKTVFHLQKSIKDGSETMLLLQVAFLIHIHISSTLMCSAQICICTVLGVPYGTFGLSQDCTGRLLRSPGSALLYPALVQL